MDTVLRPRHQNDVPDHGFSWIFRKRMMFTRSQHPQNPKLCGKRSISTQKLPTKKIIFFSKIIFSQYFWDFSTRQNPNIRDLADPGMCPYLLWWTRHFHRKSPLRSRQFARKGVNLPGEHLELSGLQRKAVGPENDLPTAIYFQTPSETPWKSPLSRI